MKLKKLIQGIENAQLKGSKDLEITGICSNSKLIGPGNLFIARKGFISDGVSFIPEAIKSGAVAVVADIYNPSLKNIVQVIHPDPSEIEGFLAARYYQFPSDQLFMVGITGTNGKTTTSFLVKYLLDSLESSTGLIGTIEYVIGGNRHPATRTTPDAVANQKMLREMVKHGCKSAVMETTSHALIQGRVSQIHYDLALFTNLTLDHLDYHGTMEAYCDAKNLLFRNLGKGGSGKMKPFAPCAIVNGDSPWVDRILAGCEARIFRYGIQHPADLMGSDLEFSSKGSRFNIHYEQRQVPCEIPLVGRFNVYNALAAIAATLLKGYPLEKIVPLLKTIPSVKGRLERVENALGLNIFVDFAHSDDALENVLRVLRELKKGRLITVFGCGGDRDRLKRPKMGAVAEKYSDLCILTSDNPRGEDPRSICQEVALGFKGIGNWMLEIDRKEAIRIAIEKAAPEDIVLIAGKGHETVQIFAHKTVEFDDHKVAQELCSGIICI